MFSKWYVLRFSPLAPFLLLVTFGLSGCGISINAVTSEGAVTGGGQAGVPTQTGLRFLEPHQPGWKVGEYDDDAYEVKGLCGVEGTVVNLSANSGAVTESATCTGGEFTATMDLSSIADGWITLATTNGVTNVSTRLMKDTAYCTPARKVAAPFAGGTGMPWDPYKVCTGTQFDEIRNYLGFHISIRNNLDVSNVVTSFGGWGIAASLAGNNFQINGLAMNQPATANLALTEVYRSGKVKDLHARNVNINGGSAASGLVSSNHGLVENLSSTGQVAGTGGWGPAGLVGENVQSGFIRNSYSRVVLTSGAQSTSGFSRTSNGRIFRSKSESTILDTDWYSCGGFVGTLYSMGSIVESVSDGQITTDLNTVGGFGGESYGEIVDSYSHSTLTATNAAQTWYNTFLSWTAAGQLLKNTYSTGLLTHPNDPIDLGGSNSAGGTFEDNFWNTDTTGQLTCYAGGHTGLDDAQSKDSASYTNWDFTDVWAMDTALSEYPVLKWELADTTAPTAPTFVYPNADNYPISYTDLNTIGTYEVEGRCAETAWPVKVVVTTPTSTYTAYEPCGIDTFWSHTITLDPAWQDSETVSIQISQRDGSGNNSTEVTRLLDVTLPTACVTNRAGVPFADGTGTVGDPWIICTETQWDAVGTATAWNQVGVNVALGDSIDFGGTHTALAIQSRTGSFNGRNFRLFNGGYNGAANYVGVVGFTDNFTTSNVHIFNTNITSTGDWIAPFGGENTTGTLSNVSYRGNITGDHRVGGIISSDFAGVTTITDVYFRGTITATDGVAGGLVGAADEGLSISNGLVRARSVTTTNGNAGGAVGRMDYGAGNSLYSSIDVFVDTVEAGGYAGGGFVGQIVQETGTAEFEEISVNVGSVNSDEDAGGFVGAESFGHTGTSNFHDISLNIGQVTATAVGAAAGGFVAQLWTTGNIFRRIAVRVGVVEANDDVAGFVTRGGGTHTFEDLYFVGYVNTTNGGTESAFRINAVADTVSDVYFDSRTAGTSSSAIGTSKAAWELYREDSFTGFNFTPITGDWKMPKNGGYPLLQREYD